MGSISQSVVQYPILQAIFSLILVFSPLTPNPARNQQIYLTLQIQERCIYFLKYSKFLRQFCPLFYFYYYHHCNSKVDDSLYFSPQHHSFIRANDWFGCTGTLNRKLISPALNVFPLTFIHRPPAFTLILSRLKSYRCCIMQV